MLVFRLCFGLALLLGLAYGISDGLEESNFLNDNPSVTVLLAALDEVFDLIAYGASKVTEIHSTDVSRYSRTGSIVLSAGHHTDQGIVGLSTNECASTLQYSFKIVLASDSCNGGVIQYFSDFACSDFYGSYPVEALIDSVEGSKVMEAGIHCTTSAIPFAAVPPLNNSVIALYHSDRDCAGKVMEYRSQVVESCFPRDAGFASYTCVKGYPQLNTFTSADCSGTPTATSVPASHCLPVDDLYDFADAPPRQPGTQDATFVADWAKSVDVRCTGGL